jgi:hypothetical protein
MRWRLIATLHLVAFASVSDFYKKLRPPSAPNAGHAIMSGLSSRTTAMRVASLITAINTLVAVGFSVAGLVNPKWILPASYVPTEASFIFALYAAARTVPLAAIALVAIYQRSESAILLLGTLAGFIQLLDAGVGLLQHDLGKSIGAFQLLAVRLSRGSVRGGVE